MARERRRLQSRQPIKVCSYCRKRKPADQFPPPGTMLRRCLACVDRPRRAPVRYRDPNYVQNWTLRNLYGITVEQYEAMFAAQGGVCAVCKRPPPGRNRLAVDHDHSTKRVRGLLCNRCNTGLGWLRDDPELVRAGLNYLLEHMEKPA